MKINFIFTVAKCSSYKEFPKETIETFKLLNKVFCIRKSEDASSIHLQNHLADSGGSPSVYVEIIETRITLFFALKVYYKKVLVILQM